MGQRQNAVRPRRATCDMEIDEQGVVNIRWDGGPSKDPYLRVIQAYTNIALKFAHEMGGCEKAYDAMKAMVQEFRAMTNKVNGTPLQEKTFRIEDPAEKPVAVAAADPQ